jgi:hypothetical protein
MLCFFFSPRIVSSLYFETQVLALPYHTEALILMIRKYVLFLADVYKLFNYNGLNAIR